MSQIDRRINNIEAQIAGLYGSTGVQSVVAGTNVTITGSPSNPIINSTGSSGVSSIVAGSGISVSGTTTVTVANTGITALVAGTGISVSGSTINNTGITALVAGTGISVSGSTINNTGITALVAGTGISVSGSTINNTGITSLVAGTGISVSGSTINNTGVQTLTAGSGVTLTGTAQNPIVSASYSPPTSGTIFDFAGGPVVVIPVNQINECVIINSLPTAPPTIQIVMNVPNYTALVAQFGANAVVHFTIGNLQNGLMPTSMLVSSVPASPANSTRFSNNLEGGVASNPQPLQMLGSYADPYSFPTACLAQMFRVSIVIDSVYQRATYCLTWLGQPS